MRGGRGDRFCDVCGLPVAGTELYQKPTGGTVRYGHRQCLVTLTAQATPPAIAVPEACPRCRSAIGHVVQRHCQSPQCTWIICRGCDHYGDPDGRRFIALSRTI